MMIKIVTVPEMREIEKEADASGLTFAEMMENAGRGLGKWLVQQFGNEKNVVGVVGSGNNGGDTLVALDFLARKGWPTCAYLVRPRPDDDPLINRAREARTVIIKPGEDENFTELKRKLVEADILLDGVLGTGIQLPLKPELVRSLGKIKNLLARQAHPIHVIAVDCPSGVDCDSGEAAAECIPAETTVCMAAVKAGLLQFPAFQFVGNLITVDIGLPLAQKNFSDVQRFIVDSESVQKILPERRLDAHKGTFGTAMLAVGSINYTGAALLSGRAAYRVGAGLVTLAIPQVMYSAIAGQFPEATWVILPHQQGVISENAADVLWDQLKRVTALLMGPGWGVEEPTLNFLKRMIAGREASNRSSSMGFMTQPSTKPQEKPNLPPLVVDADGLKLLARIPDWYKMVPRLTILTPHPGEMSVLCGLSVEAIQKERIKTAESFAREWGQVVVLKGAGTVVAEPGGKTAVIPVATPALARAGTGDVLAGIITGLRAQGMEAFEAAFAGTWIHAQAGLKAASQLGNTASVLAGDVQSAVINVMSELEHG